MYHVRCVFVILGGTKKLDARGNSLTVESHMTVTLPCLGKVRGYL